MKSIKEMSILIFLYYWLNYIYKKIIVLKKQIGSAPVITIPSYTNKSYEYFDEIVNQILEELKNQIK